MSIRTTALVLAASALLGSCVITVDSALTPTSVEFDPGLVGEWVIDDRSNQASITKAGPDRYDIVLRGDGGTSHYEGRLGHLGTRLILEVWPVEGWNGFISDPLLLAGHGFDVIERVPEGLRVRMVEQDSLIAALRRREVRLDFEVRGRKLPLPPDQLN